MSKDRPSPPATTRASIPVKSKLDSFLQAVKAGGGTVGGRGRVIFALDATMSRQPTWDMAAKLQAEMFDAVAAAGGLDVQLVFYRGDRQCSASRWTKDAKHLSKIMTGVVCMAGQTQLKKVLVHAQKETTLLKVDALVFVGDAFEKNPDEVIPEARELGRLGVRGFMFQEGSDAKVEKVFREVASATHGAHCPFDPGAAHQLGELLKAVAIYAAGGLAALKLRSDAGAVKLLGQLK